MIHDNLTDEQFLKFLEDHLAKGEDGRMIETPIFRKDDGTINRGRTLGLPCYEGIEWR